MRNWNSISFKNISLQREKERKKRERERKREGEKARENVGERKRKVREERRKAKRREEGKEKGERKGNRVSEKEVKRGASDRRQANSTDSRLPEDRLMERRADFIFRGPSSCSPVLPATVQSVAIFVLAIGCQNTVCPLQGFLFGSIWTYYTNGKRSSIAWHANQENYSKQVKVH